MAEQKITVKQGSILRDGRAIGQVWFQYAWQGAHPSRSITNYEAGDDSSEGWYACPRHTNYGVVGPFTSKRKAALAFAEGVPA